MQKYLVDEPASGDIVVFLLCRPWFTALQLKIHKTFESLRITRLCLPTHIPEPSMCAIGEIARIFNAALDKGVKLTAIFR